MIKRTLTGLVGLPLLIVIVHLGGPFLALACMGLALVGQNELYTALKVNHPALRVIGGASTVIYYPLIWREGLDAWLSVGAALLMLAVQACLALFYKRVALRDAAYALYGFFYVSFLLSFVCFTRWHEAGGYYVWLIFTSSFGCDTFAYLTGRLFGRHKLTASPSPSKSLEGVIGGILGAALMGFAYGYFTRPEDAAAVALISVAAAGCGVVGDLSASAVKRHTGIKDFGKVLPGHGGVLDRLDSVLFAAPVVYALMRVLA